MSRKTAPQGATTRQARITIDPDGAVPDLVVLAADGHWTPGYWVSDRVLDRTFETVLYLHHPSGVAAVTRARVDELAAEGRVHVVTRVLAVVGNDATAEAASADAHLDRLVADRAPAQRPSARRRAQGTRGLFGLMHVRCTQWLEHTGESGDQLRARAVSYVTEGRTDSSAGFDKPERRADLEDVVTYMEHELWRAGFDVDAADAAWQAEQDAARAASATGA